MADLPILTSIHGRRLGLDPNGALVVPQVRDNTHVAGTSDSTGTELANNGFVTVVTTTNDTWLLKDPFPGACVTIMTGSSSTGIHSVNLNNSVAYTTIGIASSTAVLTGAGAGITLYGLTTAVWALTSPISGSSAAAYVSS
jgi:hypothetical protein